MDLSLFNNSSFDRGASSVREVAWVIISGVVFSTWLPGSTWRATTLRLFGGAIGKNVVIKPRVRIKFPWKLSVGDHSWIGEGVWIDNLADVNIGESVCISQDSYLCTGSHNWNSPAFDLIVKPIVVENKAWIAAKCTVGPGVTIGEGCVICLGTVVSENVTSSTIYARGRSVGRRRGTAA